MLFKYSVLLNISYNLVLSLNSLNVSVLYIDVSLLYLLINSIFSFNKFPIINVSFEEIISFDTSLHNINDKLYSCLLIIILNSSLIKLLLSIY